MNVLAAAVYEHFYWWDPRTIIQDHHVYVVLLVYLRTMSPLVGLHSQPNRT
jgi:hypothetical protein